MRGLGAQAPPRCTKITAHPSTASVPIAVLLYKGPLLRGFNVAIKGLTKISKTDLIYFLQSLSKYGGFDIKDVSNETKWPHFLVYNHAMHERYSDRQTDVYAPCDSMGRAMHSVARQKKH